MTRLAKVLVCCVPRACWAVLSASLTSAVLLSSSVLAQTIDYGSLEQLFGESVTTSATGTPERVTEVPANMEIITADEIRRSGAYDLPGVLRHVLGVDVLQWTNDVADVGIRGYNQAFSPRVLVLIDGRQVYADHYGYTPWATLPVEFGAIRQIEIVRGPNAALFGFNAVSGVINIITYSPLYDDVNTASVRGGTQGLAQGSLIKTIRDGNKWGVRLSANGRINDDFPTQIPPSFGTLPRTGDDHFAFAVDGVARLSDRIQLGLSASHAGSASNEVDPVYSFANEQHFATSVKGQITADTSVGLVQATFYTNWIGEHSRKPTTSSIVDFDNVVTVAQLQDSFRIGAAHTLRISAEYRHNSVNTSPTRIGNVFYDLYSVSGMWNWNITPTVSLTNALRLDNVELGRNGDVPSGYPFSNSDWDRHIREWSFNTGIVWKATGSDTLRALASRGVQLPNLAHFGAFLLTAPGRVTGSPLINPTIVTNYELNWDRALPGINAQFRAAAFYQRSEDFTTVSAVVIPVVSGQPYRAAANVGNSSGLGLELALKGAFGPDWRWGANYRYENIADDFSASAIGGTRFIDFQHGTPKHVVKTNLGWARGRWEADVYLYYQSATDGLEALPFAVGTFLTPIGAYVSTDARVAYRLTDWATLSVSGQNLLQSPQKQTSGPAVERRVFATITVDF
jgi:outer membrane receptor for ferrienterochelin and colicins